MTGAEYDVFHTYPQFPNYQTCKYQVRGDSAVFAYDPFTGAMLQANNSDARITRTYTANGLLATETQQIRTVAGNDFTSHSYTLGYQYDLAGRRRHLVHPTNLSPRVNPSTAYSYESATGALQSVTDPLGNSFQYAYDNRGQLATLSGPGNVMNSFAYDQDGRVVTYFLDAPWAGGRISNTQYNYDARNKLLRSQNTVTGQDLFMASYSGLGHLASNTNWATGTTQLGDIQAEALTVAYAMDALGSISSTTKTNATTVTNGSWLGGTSLSVDRSTTLSWYNPRTGVQDSLQQGSYKERYAYDLAGNTVFQWGVGSTMSDMAQYYSADGKLRVVDRRNRLTYNSYRAVWEEYRYDALGRRVWVQTRHFCAPIESIECTLDTVQRTVWDGNQALYEIRMLEVEAENDSMPAYTAPIGSVSPVTQMGRVLNTYGPGIDQPLSVIRMGYYGFTPFAATPLWDPQGRAPYILFPDGKRDLCQGSNNCLGTVWFFGQRAFGVKENGFVWRTNRYSDNVWLGNVMRDQRDGSGLLYRRNRYYNSQTGRFTQEDPIGLAGGMNTYGFANGDPANYSDPFGLRICVKSAGLRQRIGTTYQLDIDWDDEGCIDETSSIRARPGSGAYSDLQDDFLRVLRTGADFVVVWGIGTGSSATAPYRGEPGIVTIDPLEARKAYGIRINGLCRLAKPWGQHALIAHEFGHVFNAVVRLGDIVTQRPAVDAENRFNIARGRPERDDTCEDNIRA